MTRVVFICTANRCRSPMAQGMMLAKWKEQIGTDCITSSMGVHGMDNMPPTDFAVKVCAENSIDISAIRSRPLDGDELRSADLIFVMEPFQAEYLRVFFPFVQDQLYMLGAYPDPNGTKKHTIKDPVGGSFKDYRKTYESLSKHLDRVISILKNNS